MLWGFFLKVVLADRVAIYVDAAYGNYEQFGGWYLIVATVLFAVQVYCDFYGYSVIAMGSAEILGIHLMENFDAPYCARTIAEFWRRWHISLNKWFLDYLYFPLGGSRKGKLRKYLNIMIVFLVSGLWHGAKWSYVAWGGLNGLYQIIGDVLKPIRDWLVKVLRLRRDTLSHKLFKVFATFFLFDFSLIFFRADSLQDALRILKSIFTIHNPWILFDGTLYDCGLDSKNFVVMLLAIAILMFADICKFYHIQIRKVIAQQEYWFRWMVMAGCAALILLFGIWGSVYNATGFIYFQF
jgi:D-alanyl-lipoteichoic acid acyltransferase DltB (MBOAT superfamily)